MLFTEYLCKLSSLTFYHPYNIKKKNFICKTGVNNVQDATYTPSTHAHPTNVTIYFKLRILRINK